MQMYMYTSAKVNAGGDAQGDKLESFSSALRWKEPAVIWV